MKKLLSIVLALTLVLTTLPVFANDYDQAGNTEGQNLKHFGFIQGNENGDLMEDMSLDRAQLAKIIATIHGLEDEAKAFAGESTFADAASFPAWAKPFIGFAKEKGWIIGDDKNNFNPNGKVSDEMLAIVLTRALGYEEVAFGDNAKNFTNLTKIEIPVNAALNRGQLFEALWPAVSTPVAKDGKTLGVQVGKLVPVTPDALEVLSAETSNLKEIFVSFNQDVDKENLGSFTLNNKAAVEAATVDPENAAVVILTVKNNLVDQKEYTLTVEKTKAASGVEIAKSEVKFATLDKERPTVEAVEFSGPKHITVTFSEPVKTAGKPEVRSEKVKQNVDFNGISLDGRKVTFNIYGTFKEGAEYKILIKDFKDYNGLQNIEKEVDLVFSKMTEAPTVKIVEASQTDMVVEFSTPVTGLKPSLFHHTFTKYVAYGLEDMDEEAVTATKSYSKIRVLFYAESKKSDTVQPVAAGNAKFMIDGDTIKDLWGNKLGNFKENFKVVADTEAPEVKEIKATAEDQLTVTYTKNVTVDKNKSFSVTLDKKDIFKSAAHSGKKTVITLNGKYSGKVVTVEIDKVRDTTVNENKLAPYTGTVEIGDTTPPTITSVSFKDDKEPAKTGGTLYVQFSEDMDSTTALNVVNYKVFKAPATYTTLEGDTEFYDGASIVAIKLDKDLYASAKAGSILLVSSVKDLAGNVIADDANSKMYVSTNTLEDALKLETVTGEGAEPVVATDLRTIVLTFNQEIESCDNDGIIVKNGGTTTKSESVEVNGNKVTATFKNNITALDTDNSSGTTAGYTVGKIQGRLGNPAETVDDIAIINKVAPRITNIEKTDADTVTITFDKALKANTTLVQIANDIQIFVKKDADSDYTKLDAIVKNEITMTAIGDGAKTIAFDIPGTTQFDSPVKVVIKNAEYVVSKATGAEDKETPVADQEFVSTDNDGDAEAFDFKKPVVTGVKTKSIDTTGNKVTVEITFSEKVSNSSMAVTDVKLDSTSATAVPVLSADGLTLTAVMDTQSSHYTTNKLLVIAGNFADAAGNKNAGTTFKLDVKTAEASDDIWTVQP